MPVGIGIDRKACRLAFLHLADIRLIHRDLQLHPPQIAGNGEKDRRIQRRRDRRARIDIARQHDAVDRRDDLQLGQIDLGKRQIGFRGQNRRFVDLDRRIGGVIGIFRSIQILLAGDAIADEAGQAVERGLCRGRLRLCLQHVRLGRSECGAGALDIRFLFVGVEFRQHVAGLHRAVIGHVDLADRAGQFARYIDLVGRLH